LDLSESNNLSPEVKERLIKVYNTIQQGRWNQEQAERIYNSYRDYIKHEDTLGNARINILIASQSFLFFVYFQQLKSISDFYKKSNISQVTFTQTSQESFKYKIEQLAQPPSLPVFDIVVACGICLIGILINRLLAPSIFAFIDSSSHAEAKYREQENNLLPFLSYYPPLRYGLDEIKLTEKEPGRREWYSYTEAKEDLKKRWRWPREWGWGGSESGGEVKINQLRVGRAIGKTISKIHLYFIGVWVVLFFVALSPLWPRIFIALSPLWPGNSSPSPTASPSPSPTGNSSPSPTASPSPSPTASGG
jgi:hypothetical protein